MSPEKLLILGSGPAGYTAAIYAARAQLKPVVIEGKEPGGQLMGTSEVENFPGFPEGILGPELMANMRKQAERFGARFVSDRAVSVDFGARPFVVNTEDGQKFEAEAVVIATGASARWLGIPGEEEYRGRGVSACATCDGFFFRGKKVALVGGGDAALEEASALTNFADKVFLLVRRNELRASKIMQERIKANPKIEILWTTEAVSLQGDGKKLVSARIVNNQTKEERDLLIDGFFVSVGHKPNTDIFQGQVELTDEGHVVTTVEGATNTSVEGVFTAGDVMDHRYRQAITAAGSGCKAAIDAERWLVSKRQ